MIVVIVINSQADSASQLGIWDGIGLSIWILGFGIETIADNQENRGCLSRVQNGRCYSAPKGIAGLRRFQTG